MKLFLSQKDIKEIDYLLWCKETNIGIPNLINYLLTDAYHSLYPINVKNKEEYNAIFLEESGLENEEKDELVKIKDDFNLFNFDELDLKKYLNNPYYKNIKISHKKYANLELVIDKYEAFEPFLYEEINVKDYYKESYMIGYFKKNFPFISLREGNKIWMSITPHEINTMEEPLSKMKGNVLVFGLGLGYFAYMSTLKEDVSKVIVIENNKQIIDIFNENILPSMCSSKISIINGDAFEYFSNDFINKNNINSIFIDIYHDATEINLFLKFKNIEKSIKDEINVEYWIEKSFLCYLRRYLITLIEEELDGNNDSCYTKIKSIDDKIINSLHFLLKNKEIHSYNDINNLLSDNSLREISKNIKI